jgi:hypothetical protein
MFHLFTRLFGDAPIAAQVLAFLQLAFTIWMMVSAYKRRVETFWYWIILWFQPIGAWAYFFAIEIRSRRLRGLRISTHSGERKQSLVELRYSVERAPTVANRFALAERLMEVGSYAEAIPLLEAVLAIDPNYCSVLHALAKCRIATGNPDLALAPLQRLMQRDKRWANYLAWHTLVEVQMARGQPAEALEASRELAKHLPTLQNKCLLGVQLLGNDRPAEAMQVLREALVDHSFTPWLARLRNRGWASEARRLQALAETSMSKKVELGANTGSVEAVQPQRARL